MERALPYPGAIDCQNGVQIGQELFWYIRLGGYVLSGHARGQAAGYVLEYSRDRKNKGYYLKGQPALSPEFSKMVKASIAEVDQRQIDIYQRLSAADRFRQGCAISDTARNVVAYRIRQENPELTVLEAHRLALQRAYTS